MQRGCSTSIRSGHFAAAGFLMAIALLFVNARTVLAEDSDQAPAGGARHARLGR